jgi:hypothetical protein
MATNGKLEKCVKLLETLKDQPGDIMECAAICILDLQDVLDSIEKQDLFEYRKQRKDCLKTMKAFYKLVKKIKYTIK